MAENVLILGTGPAGLTAAIYSARANLKPLVVEGMQSGGQLTITSDVENYPGFPKGIMGPELMAQFRAQAERFGARFVIGEVKKTDLSGKTFKLSTDKETFEARTLIISTGASANLIGLKNESRLMGKGVSTCATCDGFFFKGLEIAVVGGGDSACEEAGFLTKFASKVTLIHRRDKLRASKIMQDRVFNNPKIKVLWETGVEDVLGKDEVTGLALKNLKTSETSELPLSGLFVAIGHSPNTSIFKGQLEMDQGGYLITREGTKTNIPGVFAAGDVQDHVYRQAITAAGTGCMAAIDAERYLENLGHH
jgi:thioredoxin reductase (NADPH)